MDLMTTDIGLEILFMFEITTLLSCNKISENAIEFLPILKQFCHTNKISVDMTWSYLMNW